MPTEVTNEQFAEFVRATGAKPPYYWYPDLEAARLEFLGEENRKKQEAKARGERYETERWDGSMWWDDNWEGKDWAVPSDRLNYPVNYVSFEDATAYADWAGLRLMTEIEFQRAARGGGEEAYPWGDDWDPEACNSLDNRDAGDALPVGSYEAGAVNGVYDLVGNVWEWTATKYRKYDGYKPVKVKLSRNEEVHAMAGFDPTLRVVVGGAYTAPGFGCRVSVRQGEEKTQSAAAVGFRCAADLKPGAVAANSLIEREVRRNVLSREVEFDPEASSILLRWESTEGSVDIPGYAVITDYRRTMFCPITNAEAGSPADLGRSTEKDGPLYLGFVAFPFPLVEPALDGGTYFVAWRGAAKLKDDDKDPTSSNPYWDADGFVAEQDSFLFYDLEGVPVVAFPAGPCEFKKATGPSRIQLEPYVPPTEEEKAAMIEEGIPLPPKVDALRYSLVVPGKSRNKTLHVDLVVKIDPGTIDDTWK